MNHIKTKLQVLCALFAALCAVCAQVVIPVQPVPITLGTFAVLLAGGFLGARYGLISLCIYILLGIVGVPVFSMMKGGLAVLGGPTGGFIIGYLPMVFLTGFIAVSYTHLRAHETKANLVCRLLLEKKKKKEKSGQHVPVSYTHLTLPTNREV